MTIINLCLCPSLWPFTLTALCWVFSNWNMLMLPFENYPEGLHKAELPGVNVDYLERMWNPDKELHTRSRNRMGANQWEAKLEVWLRKACITKEERTHLLNPALEGWAHAHLCLWIPCAGHHVQVHDTPKRHYTIMLRVGCLCLVIWAWAVFSRYQYLFPKIFARNKGSWECSS